MTIQLPTLTTPGMDRPDPLAPVRAFLLAQARREAGDERARATADADAAVAQARKRATEILADAGRRGAADGAAIAGVERMRARREAREILLRVQREAYDELRDRARSAVRALRNHPSYPILRDRLGRLAQSRAGPGASLADHPDGGVVAVTADRRVDCSLDTLADHALDALGADVEGLWKP